MRAPVADDDCIAVWRGATYLVLAPEHDLVATLTTPARRELVEAYVLAAQRKSDLDRTDLAKEKTGTFTGAYAINPVNGERIPIWIADYVLVRYGTGAIMAVPAHDARDAAFAAKFALPSRQVVRPVADGVVDTDGVFTVDGIAINSDFLNGLSTDEAKATITAWLERKRRGKAAVSYRLRDWLFSRQRSLLGKKRPGTRCSDQPPCHNWRLRRANKKLLNYRRGSNATILSCGIAPLVGRHARIVTARLDTYRPSPCPPARVDGTALFPSSTPGAFIAHQAPVP